MFETKYQRKDPSTFCELELASKLHRAFREAGPDNLAFNLDHNTGEIRVTYPDDLIQPMILMADLSEVTVSHKILEKEISIDIPEVGELTGLYRLAYQESRDEQTNNLAIIKNNIECFYNSRLQILSTSIPIDLVKSLEEYHNSNKFVSHTDKNHGLVLENLNINMTDQETIKIFISSLRKRNEVPRRMFIVFGPIFCLIDKYLTKKYIQKVETLLQGQNAKIGEQFQIQLDNMDYQISAYWLCTAVVGLLAWALFEDVLSHMPTKLVLVITGIYFAMFGCCSVVIIAWASIMNSVFDCINAIGHKLKH